MTYTPVDPSTRVAVDTLLGLARLPMSDEEHERLLRWYPFMREQADALRIPEVRYGAPALTYSAAETRSP